MSIKTFGDDRGKLSDVTEASTSPEYLPPLLIQPSAPMKSTPIIEQPNFDKAYSRRKLFSEGSSASVGIRNGCNDDQAKSVCEPLPYVQKEQEMWSRLFDVIK